MSVTEKKGVDASEHVMTQQSTNAPTRALRAIFIVLLAFVAYKFYQQHVPGFNGPGGADVDV